MSFIPKKLPLTSYSERELPKAAAKKPQSPVSSIANSQLQNVSEILNKAKLGQNNKIDFIMFNSDPLVTQLLETMQKRTYISDLHCYQLSSISNLELVDVMKSGRIPSDFFYVNPTSSNAAKMAPVSNSLTMSKEELTVPCYFQDDIKKYRRELVEVGDEAALPTSLQLTTMDESEREELFLFLTDVQKRFLYHLSNQINKSSQQTQDSNKKESAIHNKSSDLKHTPHHKKNKEIVKKQQTENSAVNAAIKPEKAFKKAEAQNLRASHERKAIKKSKERKANEQQLESHKNKEHKEVRYENVKEQKLNETIESQRVKKEYKP